MCSWIGGKNCIGSKATKIGSKSSHSIDYNEVGGSERLATPNHQILGKVSAQPHTIVKQICFPNGNVFFLSLFSLFKN